MMMAMTRVVGYCTSRALDLRRERLMADGGGAGATIILHIVWSSWSMIFTQTRPGVNCAEVRNPQATTV